MQDPELSSEASDSFRARSPWLALIFLFVAASFAAAADLHVTPSGAGRKDGADWNNAFDQGALASTAMAAMKPGDRLLVGSGTYPNAALRIAAGGEPDRPKIIEGVARDGGGLPLFVSSWSVDTPTKGATAVRIDPGASHVLLRNLYIRGYQHGVQAPAVESAAGRTHLAFENVDIEQMRHGFYLSDCDDTQFTGCDLKRYSKHGFRFEAGCDRVTLKQCTADCSEGDTGWETKTESLPFGFLLNDKGAPNTAFIFEDCLARNHMMPLQKGSYKNGDGFVVEGNASEVVFRRCRAIRNQDGGFDLKVAGVELTDCVAYGNKRDYRIWKTGTLTNCFSGWSQLGLWCDGGPVRALRCTFHRHADAAAATDDHATAPITLADCLISFAGTTPKAQPTKGRVHFENSVVLDAKNAGENPAFQNANPSWNGLGDTMDSRVHPDKGYRAPRK